MKALIALFLFLLSCISIHAQPPSWEWAKSAGGTNSDIGYGVTTDRSGNVYVTGTFSSISITFGDITLHNTGNFDIYIVKYDNTGKVMWAKSAGGTWTDEGKSISVDSVGNVYITGFFESASITFDTITLRGTQSRDFFIVKYDFSGNVMWARNAGENWNEYGNSIVADAKGNTYITGTFQSTTINFGSIKLTNPKGIGNSIFVVKYDTYGNALWAKSAGGDDDAGTGICMDSKGNVITTGYFTSPTIKFDSYVLTNKGNRDFFTVKYSSEGNVLWAKSEGGNDDDRSLSVTTDGVGNVFIAGYFYTQKLILGKFQLVSAGIGDIFIVKYDTSGNLLWTKSYGDKEYDSGTSICTDEHGNVYVTGQFSRFLACRTDSFECKGYSDIFVIKFDNDGNEKWAKSVGGYNDESGLGITSNNDNILLTGSYVSFTIAFGTTVLTSEGGSADMFVAKLSSKATNVEEESSLKQILRFYPNPITYSASLKTDIHLNDATLIVYNIFGQQIHKTSNLSGQTITFLRGTLPNGMYTYYLMEHDAVIAHDKFIITN